MGCHIHRVREAREIYIDQHLFTESFVNSYDISMKSELPALVDRHTVLSKEDSPQSPKEREVMKGIPYREAVGELLWASLMTRPGITSAVRTVAKFCDGPGPEHWKTVVKILQYLLLTKDEGLKYGGEGP